MSVLNLKCWLKIVVELIDKVILLNIYTKIMFSQMIFHEVNEVDIQRVIYIMFN